MFWKKIVNLKLNLSKLINMLIKQNEFRKKEIISHLQTYEYKRSPKSIVPYGYKIYSKDEEDGIISEIFNRIGTTNKFFIEIGVGDGLENNTLALLFSDWKGLWIEGSLKNTNKIINGFRDTIARNQLRVVNAFCTIDNITNIINDNCSVTDPDLISIDVDGNDYHLLAAILDFLTPRVIVIETNPKFRPPIMYCMKYNESHIWDGSDNYGVSLKYLEVKLGQKGYNLVGVNLTGGNAFFVRHDLTGDKFFEPFSAENHYQPARFEIATHLSGHRASYNTLENRL